jgi:hypothetical protein
MSDEERGPPVRHQRQFISKSITALYWKIDEVHQEVAMNGDVSDETKQELTSELSTVVMLLRPHRNDGRIEWQEATPFEDGPDHLIGRLLEGDTDYKRQTGVHAPEKREVKVPAQFDIEQLYSAANDMLEIAHKLGLTADIPEKTDTEYPDPV